MPRTVEILTSAAALGKASTYTCMCVYCIYRLVTLSLVVVYSGVAPGVLHAVVAQPHLVVRISF